MAILFDGVSQVLSFVLSVLFIPFLIWIFSKIFKLKNSTLKTTILVGVVDLLGMIFIGAILISFFSRIVMPSLFLFVLIFGFINMALLMILMKIFYKENKSYIVAFFAWLIYYAVFPFLLWRYSLYL